MKALIGAFNQEKALVGAFSVILKTDCNASQFLARQQQCSWRGQEEHNPTYKVKVWRGGRGGSKLVGIRVKTLLSFTLRMIYDFLLFPGLMMTNRLNLNQSCDTVSNCHCYT